MVRQPPQRKPNTAALALEAAQCFDLKVQGYSLRQIAELTGLSKDTVSNRIRHAVDTMISPRVEDYRALQDQQIDALEAEVLAVMRTVDQPETRLKAVDRLVRLMERRARLHGIDAPVKVDATITQQTQQEIELEALFANLDAQNEERRQLIEGNR